jgi:hypothetical protein
MFVIGLPETQGRGHLLKHWGWGPSNHTSVELDAKVTSTVNFRAKSLSHTKRDQKRGDVGNGEGSGDDTTCSGKMVEETAGRTIRCVHGAQETFRNLMSVQLWNHIKEYGPQASGSSLRTVVVFSSAKKAPRCIDRK